MLIASKRITPAFKKALIDVPQPQYMTPTSLCDWIIREAPMQDYEMLLCINVDTQMPVVLPGADFLKVSPVSVLRQILMFVMSGMGISSLKLTEYVDCVAHGEVRYQNTTSNFLVEAAYRAYAAELAKVDPNHFEDDKLMNQFGILSLTLGSDPKIFRNPHYQKVAPAVQFKNLINYDWCLPAERKGTVENNSSWNFDYRLFHQWDQQFDRTPADAGYSTIIREMRKVNDAFLKKYQEYLQRVDVGNDQRLQHYVRLADLYLNRYLPAVHPETITSDLTAPTAYLFEYLLERCELIKPTQIQEIIDAMLALGAFIKVSGVYSSLDADIYRQAVRDGGDRLQAFFKAASLQAEREFADDQPVSRQVVADGKDASLSQLVENLTTQEDDEQLAGVILTLISQRPQLIDKVLAKLPVEQQHLLLKKLTQLLTDD